MPTPPTGAGPAYRPGTMEDFVNKMVEKVGIDKATAEKVLEFLKDHTDDAMKYLQESGIKDKLPGGLGKLF